MATGKEVVDVAARNDGVDVNADSITKDSAYAAAVQLPGSSSVHPAVSVHHGEKPEKFDGLNFKRWQQKMLFYLTTLNLARFLTEDAPKLSEGETDKQAFNAVEAWKHSDFLCRN